MWKTEASDRPKKEKKEKMYLHLGGSCMVRQSKILGIFDLDQATVSHITRKYLKKKTKENRVITASDEVPKSFVVTAENQVYLSQLSSSALLGRSRESM